MQRREFISLLGGAAAWPLTVRARPAIAQPKVPVIGFLGADPTHLNLWTAAFVDRLRELGWVESRNIRIEYRWNGGLRERDAEIAAEFLRLKLDLIVSVSTAVPTIRQATADIPIVFPIAPDPIGG